MRHINKGKAHRTLEQRNQNPPTNAHQASTAWRNFRRKETRENCLQEQYGLCGYSEINLINTTQITDPQSGKQISRDLGIHLEHIEPKSAAPAKTFNHDNLIACAIDNTKARQLVNQDIFGGHAKLKWFHPDALIHPLKLNCRDYFHYEASGKITPKVGLPRRERAKARLTIYKLNLNAAILVNWRKVWLTQTDNIIAELANDIEALQHFAQIELLPINGLLRPFHSAQRQLLGKVGEQIIQTYFTE